jgi:hypothetical protein
MAVRESEAIVRGSRENDNDGVLMIRADRRLAFACPVSVDLFGLRNIGIRALQTMLGDRSFEDGIRFVPF